MFRLPDPITEQRLYEAQRDLSPLNRESLKTDVVHDSSNTKEILNNIDKEVAEAQNKRNLEELQRNLDTSGLEKMGPDNPVFMEYRNVDLTKLRLIYDGQLTLNLGGENRRVKNIELYVLLLEDCVMFLQVTPDI